MPGLEATIARLTKGHTVEIKSTGAARRFLATKKTGFLQRDERLLVVAFEKEQPSVQKLDWFFDEATKFVKTTSVAFEITGIVLLTPSEVDKSTWRALLKGVDSEVSKFIRAKTYDDANDDEQTSTSIPIAVRTPAKSLAATLDALLSSPAPKERVLYAWEMIYRESGATPLPVVIAVTQERCLAYRRVGPDFAHYGKDHRWDQVTQVGLAGEAGSEFVKINEETREIQLVHQEAEFVARTLHHLWWTRRGFLTGFAESYEWDHGLVVATSDSLLKGRYVEAVRNGYAHVESSIRDACNLPDGARTDAVLQTAFAPKTGVFRFGVTDADYSGLFSFVSGAFALFRNPSAHERPGGAEDRNQAIQALGIANAILTLLSRGKAAQKTRPLIRPAPATDSTTPTFEHP